MQRVSRLHQYGLQSALVLFVFFALHRAMTFPFFADALQPRPLFFLQAILVGLASDLWVAAVGSFGLVLVLACCHLFGRRWGGLLAPLFYLSMAFLLGLHQSYAEFFHAPLLSFHIPYLIDPDFVSANSSSLLTWRPLATWLLLAAFLALVWWRRRQATSRWPAGKAWGLLVALYAFALAGHALNIRYRVQWFIPDALQMNLFEALYSQSKALRQPRDPDAGEWQELAQYLGGKQAPAANAEALLLEAPAAGVTGGSDPDGAPAQRLRAAFQELVAQGKKPLLLTILSESLRAVDSASYGGQNPSLTPHFDELARHGLLFQSAWSTGTVTRAGQEAVWCGYLGNMTNSLMRTYTQVALTCLPDLNPAASFWYHGGEGRFDNQLHFWRKHQVADLLTQSDFPRQAARTGWGVGDRTFLQTAARRIVQRDRSLAVPFQLGLLLTVSHHIPWDLPADAPATLREAPYRGLHASEHTLAYTDFALGEFVTALKLAGVWERTILVVVGDHGIVAPPLQDVGPAGSLLPVQKAKVAMVLSGGLTEHLVAGANWPQAEAARLLAEHTSQADVASLLAFIAGFDTARFMGETPLLQARRRRPVVADLGTSVYFPALAWEVSLAELLQGYHASERMQVGERYMPSLYYRSVLATINAWSQQREQGEASARAAKSL